MNRRYRISRQGRPGITDEEIARYADTDRLMYNYHRAVRPIHQRPLYKDRRMFIALVIIVLLAILIAEVM